MERQLRIAIVGAGAVGGYYGGLLARAGMDVHFLLRSDHAVIAAQGLRIESPNGDFHLPADRLNITDRADRLPPVDLVLLATKATSNEHLPELLRPIVGKRTMVLCVQNGIGGVEACTALLGAERVLAGLGFICTNRIAPGHIRHMGFGLIRFGPISASPVLDPAALERALQAGGLPIELSDDIHRDRWGKLVWNIPFNGLGAAMDLSVDRLVNHPRGLELVESIMREVIALARSLGHTFPGDLVEQQIAKTVRMGAYKTSMQLDRQAGRPLERDAIITRPLTIARREGVLMPIVETIDRQLACFDVTLNK